MLRPILHQAIQLRESLGIPTETEAYRVFYGPGETVFPELKDLAIDRFQNHFWITTWNSVSEKTLSQVIHTLKEGFPSKVESVVMMDREEIESKAIVKVLDGAPPVGKISVLENGIRYLVQLENVKHPGLFLDHAPLRYWLKNTQKNKTVLNLFAYTGSLSVAAGKGGASHVTTLDLSKATITWAKENWMNENLSEEKSDFIFGDVFEWLPKFAKKNRKFDTILCDPPSFSRSKSGTFSTSKDLMKLHLEILPLLDKGGILVSSINSENVSEKAFLSDIEGAATKLGIDFQVLKRVDLPESFPTGRDLRARYLKGFYIRVL